METYDIWVYRADPQLGHDPGDGGDEAQQREHSDGDDHGKGDVAAGHRRPDGSGERDGDRRHRRQADDDVQRSAGSVGQKDETGGHRPADHESDGDQAKFEGADPHGRESMRVVHPTRKPRGGAPGRRRGEHVRSEDRGDAPRAIGPRIA